MIFDNSVDVPPGLATRRPTPLVYLEPAGQAAESRRLRRRKPQAVLLAFTAYSDANRVFLPEIWRHDSGEIKHMLLSSSAASTSRR